MFPQNFSTLAGTRGLRLASTRRDGATTVELALTLPIFLMFLMGAFEFGWLNVIRHTADNAAYEAARHAMVPGATAAEAIAKAELLLRVVGTRDARIIVAPETITKDAEAVTVTIEVPVDRNALVLPKFARGRVLRSSSTHRTERAILQP